MKTTVFYRDGERERKINFLMRDVFNNAIRKEARKIIRYRFPEIKERITRYEWRY